MMGTELWIKRERNTGDAAIDGLYGGLAGGLGMGLILVLAGLLSGESPGAILVRFGTGSLSTPLQGGLVHLAVSGVYGLAFGLLVRMLPARMRDYLPGWLAGLLYGGLLLGIALGVVLPGLRSPLLDLPLWALAAAHGLYGILVGVVAYPKSARKSRR